MQEREARACGLGICLWLKDRDIGVVRVWVGLVCDMLRNWKGCSIASLEFRERESGKGKGRKSGTTIFRSV